LKARSESWSLSSARLARASLAALLLGVTAGACTSDLELALDGRACTPGPRRCLDGYVCDERDQRCVLPGELSAGGLSGAGSGSAGASGSGSSGMGAGGVDGGASGAAGAAGAVPTAGAANGGAGAGGTGGAPVDAGDADASDGCVAVTLYRDGDRDGVGDVAQSRVGCPEPGWVTQPGDCRDDLEDVFLGQTLFFSQPYQDVAGASFDYDCNNLEEPDPSTSPLTTPPECETLGAAVSCVGSGYLPTSPLRSGTGVEARCGSNLRRDCISVSLLDCGSQDVLLDPSIAFRCH
jgi:hypothetical protein